MSMGTHIKGFRPPDEKYKKMTKAYYACRDAGLDIPAEVERYFEDQEPDPAGMEIDLGKAAQEWTDGDMRQGIEVDVNKLPKGVTIIRFYNSF